MAPPTQVRCNGEALPGALQPGDLAVWDGHVAMVVDNSMMIEARYQSIRDAERPPSWHRLGPGDMPREAKRCRHRLVAVPIVAIARLVALCPRQQRADPQ